MSDSAIAPSALDLIVKGIEQEFAARPPTIGVIGLSGVGKTTTINAMFGTSRHTSATVRGTNRFNAADIEFVSDRVADARVKCAFRFYDAVGLGEDKRLDGNYLKRYREHLPKCDVAVWVLAVKTAYTVCSNIKVSPLSKISLAIFLRKKLAFCRWVLIRCSSCTLLRQTMLTKQIPQHRNCICGINTLHTCVKRRLNLKLLCWQLTPVQSWLLK